jgi:tetratricopeptide (TPR) repeat protein
VRAAHVESEAVNEARALARDAQLCARGGDPALPLSLCDRALARLSDFQPNETLADILRLKGNILRDCGDHARALDYYAQSLAIADAIFYTVGRAHALNCFGTMEQFRGDLTRAARWYRSAQRLAKGLGDNRLVAMIEQNLGIVAAIGGQLPEALAHFRVALEAFEQSGGEQESLWVLNNMGNLYTRQGEYELAASSLQGALELAKTLGDVASEGVVEENRSRLLLALGDLDQAELAANRALEIAARRRDATRQAAAVCCIAMTKRARERLSPEVPALLDRALDLAVTGEDAEMKSEILREIANSCEDRGDRNNASSYRQAATKYASGSVSPTRNKEFDPGSESQEARP